MMFSRIAVLALVIFTTTFTTHAYIITQSNPITASFSAHVAAGYMDNPQDNYNGSKWFDFMIESENGQTGTIELEFDLSGTATTQALFFQGSSDQDHVGFAEIYQDLSVNIYMDGGAFVQTIPVQNKYFPTIHDNMYNVDYFNNFTAELTIGEQYYFEFDAVGVVEAMGKAPGTAYVEASAATAFTFNGVTNVPNENVPEPSSIILLSAGLLLLGFRRKTGC